jgi:hypothetical protein
MTPVTNLAILGAEAAALGNARTVIDLVGFIVAKAQEARSFKTECLQLTNMCINLSMAFLEHEKQLSDLRTKKEFEQCLRDIYLAVMECRGWNVLHVGWEVLVSHKLQSLKIKLDEIQKNFGIEMLVRYSVCASVYRLIRCAIQMTITTSTAKTNQELKSMQENMTSLRVTNAEGNEQRAQFLDRIRSLEAEISGFQRDARSLTPISSTSLDLVTIPNPDLQITMTINIAGEEVPRLGVYKGLNIAFEKIVHKNFERLPQIVRIYQQIGTVALVQQLHAIALLGGTKYALMENVESLLSIEDAAANGNLAKYTKLQRLRFAHELTTTVSCLHEAGVLIKCLSDTSILIVASDDGIRPKLTGLAQARAVSSMVASLEIS